MTIHSYFKAEKGDPDWQFTPEQYFDKKFKIIDANTIELTENVSDRVILRQTPSDKSLLAKHLRISVLNNSELELVVINDAAPHLQQIFLYDVHVHENANLSFNIFAKDGKLNKHIIQVFLYDGAQLAISGLMSNTVGGDTEIITKIVHQGINSQSDQLVYGMAGNSSQTVFQSMTLIAEGSNGSSANIENSNLILSDGSRCYGKPDVFVGSDGVSASYGSFSEYLTNDKLTYLQSRGISIEKAREMIINGFRDQSLDFLQSSDLLEELKQLYTL